MRTRSILLSSILLVVSGCGLRQVRLDPKQIATLDFAATPSVVCANDSDVVLQVAVHYRDRSRLVLRRDATPADALIDPRELVWSSAIGSVDPTGVMHLPADRRDWLHKPNQIRVAVARAPQFTRTLALTPRFDCGTAFVSGSAGATGKPGEAGPTVSVVLSYFDAETAARLRAVLAPSGLGVLRDIAQLLDLGLFARSAAPRVARAAARRTRSSPREIGPSGNFVMAHIAVAGQPPAVYLIDATAGRPLTIIAHGGDGGPGVKGRAGFTGMDGSSGIAGMNGMFCSDGGNGTNGGDGSTGGDGGDGGPGGNGGVGGNVEVEFDARYPELPTAVAISVDGGRGGPGGRGGDGGRGGQGGRGGSGGSGGTACAPNQTSHRGVDGQSGQPGRDGHSGSAGPDGQPGAPGKVHVQAVPPGGR